MTDPKKMTVTERHRLAAVLQEIRRERHRQHAKWGAQPSPDATPGAVDWWREFGHTADAAKQVCENTHKRGDGCHLFVLYEEVCEALEEACNGNTAALRAELVQVAAVASKWIEQIDARPPGPKTVDLDAIEQDGSYQSRHLRGIADTAAARELRALFESHAPFFDREGCEWTVEEFNVKEPWPAGRVTFEARLQRVPHG